MVTAKVKLPVVRSVTCEKTCALAIETLKRSFDECVPNKDISLRDHFAAAALQGMLAKMGGRPGNLMIDSDGKEMSNSAGKEISSAAYAWANYMLSERSKS